ncbi:type VII secretion target [Amycolatopsis tolypomycina]|uniref:Excreted virulence factor EspC, type VII ESX diderm n=1 Tax=Amycolatopsis tolypomycina TaxID=208445 RepID=A0A1H5ASE2_9PSEU|nr:type VII secretion target [Amycolatopsis tolypomycina]SED44721.1 Excreted virulence factor EspC, type VII ESX diderm [Amycolatopsis tolypomycina]
MTGFGVAADELTVHAGHLDGIERRLAAVAEAAASAAMSGNAYGLLCSFLPPCVNPVEDKGKAALAATVEAVRTTAVNVRTAAGSYRQREDASTQPFRDYLA